MAYTKNFKDRRPQSSEIVHLGTVLHPCGEQLVIKIEHGSIPYPGAPVFYESKQIGKVDEIFGRLDEAYAAVKPDEKNSFSKIGPGKKMGAFKEKFIAPHRFMSREQTEKKKTESTQKQGGKRPKGNGGGFNKQRGFKPGFKGNNRGQSDRDRGFADKKKFGKPGQKKVFKN